MNADVKIKKIKITNNVSTVPQLITLWWPPQHQPEQNDREHQCVCASWRSALPDNVFAGFRPEPAPLRHSPWWVLLYKPQ